MKSSKYPLSSFWRKETLNITNDKNQHTKQENNFYHIIDKKLNTASNLPGCIKTNSV